jgi:hypothetical protein
MIPKSCRLLIPPRAVILSEVAVREANGNAVEGPLTAMQHFADAGNSHGADGIVRIPFEIVVART